MRLLVLFGALMAGVLFSGSSQGALINNTGGAGWFLTATPSGPTGPSVATIATSPNAAWNDVALSSKWISVSENTGLGVFHDLGSYTWETSFMNAAFGQVADFNISLLYDNQVTVFFNGNQVFAGADTGLSAFGSVSGFSFSADANVGTNVLKFVVKNNDAGPTPSANPVGLNVTVNSSGLTQVPEPMSIALWGSLACVGLIARRRFVSK
jgi:hypothetical protein